MSTGRNQFVTPYNSPQRFNEQEKRLFDEYRCCWQVSTTGNEQYCGEPSKPGASFGHCPDHDEEMLESYYPDGSRR